MGLALLAGADPAIGQGASPEVRMERVRRLMAEPNPLTASDSVWIAELTYMEVRDRIAEGTTTAIVPTGGIEENGPYLATGKHNVILHAMCPAIAGELGNALCAPIVQFVPEGDIDPPSGAMFFPGTISVRDATYVALLEDIGGSLRQHGFTDIVFIGDSGGNQRGMKEAAGNLNAHWRNTGARAHFVEEFYTTGWDETEKYTEEVLGVSEGESDGHHDDIWVTAREGHEFEVAETSLHAGGSHGALNRDDSTAPLIVAGLPEGVTVPEFPRTIDLAPLCLQALGLQEQALELITSRNAAPPR